MASANSIRIHGTTAQANALWDAGKRGGIAKWYVGGSHRELRSLDGEVMRKILLGASYEAPKRPEEYAPATMVAAIRSVRPLGNLAAVQLTQLRSTGSEWEPVHVEIIGSPGDGAVLLAKPQPGKPLGLAVSPNQALEAERLFRIPTWAVCSRDRFTSVGLLANVSEVKIFAEDKSSDALIRATIAMKEYERLGIKASVEWPWIGEKG